MGSLTCDTIVTLEYYGGKGHFSDKIWSSRGCYKYPVPEDDGRSLEPAA